MACGGRRTGWWRSGEGVGPVRLAEQGRIVLGANRTYRIRDAANAELRALAHLVNELADQRDALHTDVDRQVRESRSLLEEERNRLAALISQLAQGIVACNLDGRILLYNSRASLQLTALTPGPGGAGALIGLGRSIFSLIDRALVDHALDGITRRLDGGGRRAVANFVTASRAGQLIRVQMAPVLVPGPNDVGQHSQRDSVSGYVLVLENITRRFEAEARHDQALLTLTEGSRAALANIRAAVETLAGYPDMELGQRERFVRVISEEVRSIGERLEQNAAQHAQALKTRWVLEEMQGADLVDAVRKTIETRFGIVAASDASAPDLWVKADTFTVVRALAHVAERLRNEFGVRELRLRLNRCGPMAQLDLLFPRSAAPLETLQDWERQAMASGDTASPLTLQDVAERHDGEAWFQHDAAGALSFLRLLLPIAEPEHATPRRAEAPARPVYYDFALFARTGAAHALDERPLAELSYTVFDTETTGLAPDDGDEIIQVGAVRIVNMRLLHGETFDQLVDPGRRLNPASVKIHGITADMLRGQPAIDEVLPAFHAFCEDTVMIGHNAAFDMRFLQLKEPSTGVRFGQPLLDTLLLSEVIHPTQESHRLEAIAERLGVRIEGRHSALGDALATAEVFLRLIGLLEDAGIHTLRQAREAASKTPSARIRY